jgi:hypothetical protein
MNWKKNSSASFCNHSSNNLFDGETTPFEIFLVLRYKSFPSRGIIKGVSAVGDVNSNFNGKSQWEEVRNFSFCHYSQIHRICTGCSTSNCLLLDFAVQAGWL